MSVMKSTMPTKPSKYRGWLVLGGGALVAISAAMMSGTNWMPETQPTAVTQSVPAAAGKICEGENCTTQAAIDAQIVRLALSEQTMNDDGIQCKFVDDVGRQDCVDRIASIKKRWRQ